LRRLELTLALGHSEDFARVRGVVLDVADRSTLCLAEPAPSVFISALGETSVQVQIWLWTRTEHLQELRASITEEIQRALAGDEESHGPGPAELTCSFVHICATRVHRARRPPPGARSRHESPEYPVSLLEIPADLLADPDGDWSYEALVRAAGLDPTRSRHPWLPLCPSPGAGTRTVPRRREHLRQLGVHRRVSGDGAQGSVSHAA